MSDPVRVIFDLRNRLNTPDMLVRDARPLVRAAEEEVAKAADAAGRGPRGLALNVAKTSLGNAIALLTVANPVATLPEVDGLGLFLMLAQGWTLRAEEGGAAVGSG